MLWHRSPVSAPIPLTAVLALSQPSKLKGDKITLLALAGWFLSKANESQMRRVTSRGVSGKWGQEDVCLDPVCHMIYEHEKESKWEIWIKGFLGNPVNLSILVLVQITATTYYPALHIQYFGDTDDNTLSSVPWEALVKSHRPYGLWQHFAL